MRRSALALLLLTVAGAAGAQEPLDGATLNKRLPSVTPKPTFSDGRSDEYRALPVPRPAPPATASPATASPETTTPSPEATTPSSEAKRAAPTNPVGPPARVPPIAVTRLPDDTCLKALRPLAEVERAVSPEADDAGCVVEDPVRVAAVRTRGGPVAISGSPVLTCRFATALAEWTRDIAAPLAAGRLDRRLTRIGTGPGFQCRRRNRRATGKLSEHAFGNAVDVVSFEFGSVGGSTERATRVDVAPAGEMGADEAAYLRALRRAACGYFTTILGPGSDAAHARHLHLDRGRLFKDGKRRRNPYRICN